MTPNAVVWWVFLVASIVVLAMAGAQAARAFGEIKRLGSRVEGFADLPVVKALDRLDDDLRRLEASIAGITPLMERAQAAVAVIRRGPVPPELIAAVRRAGAGFAALRAAVRR